MSCTVAEKHCPSSLIGHFQSTKFGGFCTDCWSHFCTQTTIKRTKTNLSTVFSLPKSRGDHQQNRAFLFVEFLHPQLFTSAGEKERGSNTHKTQKKNSSVKTKRAQRGPIHVLCLCCRLRYWVRSGEHRRNIHSKGKMQVTGFSSASTRRRWASGCLRPRRFERLSNCSKHACLWWRPGCRHAVQSKIVKLWLDLWHNSPWFGICYYQYWLIWWPQKISSKMFYSITTGNTRQHREIFGHQPWLSYA